MRVDRIRRSLRIALVLLCIAAGAQGSQLEAADAAYERGDFAAAVAGYRSALEGGAEHALVHYNLGNAYFKQGELGRAIASYVRAHRLAPRDERIATNLERARAQQRDRELAVGTVPAVLRPVPWLYGRLSLDEWWFVALLGYALFVVVRIAGHWTTMSRQWVRWIAVGSITVALLGTLMGSARFRDEVVRASGIAVLDEIEVRSGPGRDYALSFRIHEGLHVRLAERRDSWIRIELGGDLTGWVPVDSIEPL